MYQSGHKGNIKSQHSFYAKKKGRKAYLRLDDFRLMIEFRD